MSTNENRLDVFISVLVGMELMGAVLNIYRKGNDHPHCSRLPHYLVGETGLPFTYAYLVSVE